MRASLSITTAITICLSQSALALPKPRPCDGFFLADTQGMRLSGGKLTPAGPMVPNGASRTFSRMKRIAGHFYLFEAGSSTVFDATNVGLQTGCLLPDH